jgi:DNA repair exonuclease SbcCD ATPase subunit
MNDKSPRLPPSQKHHDEEDAVARPTESPEAVSLLAWSIERALFISTTYGNGWVALFNAPRLSRNIGESTMTENELAEATDRLARAEEKFLNTITLLIEGLNAVRESMKDNRELFNDHLHAFDKTEELMQKQINLMREITAGMEAVVKAAGENNTSLNETNERMKALLSKVESYFGSPSGLEYDN